MHIHNLSTIDKIHISTLCIIRICIRTHIFTHQELPPRLLGIFSPFSSVGFGENGGNTPEFEYFWYAVQYSTSNVLKMDQNMHKCAIRQEYTIKLAHIVPSGPPGAIGHFPPILAPIGWRCGWGCRALNLVNATIFTETCSTYDIWFWCSPRAP